MWCAEITEKNCKVWCAEITEKNCKVGYAKMIGENYKVGYAKITEENLKVGYAKITGVTSKVGYLLSQVVTLIDVHTTNLREHPSDLPQWSSVHLLCCLYTWAYTPVKQNTNKNLSEVEEIK